MRIECITFFHFQPRAPAIKITMEPRAWQPDSPGGCETLGQNDIAADLGAIRNQRVPVTPIKLRAPAV